MLRNRTYFTVVRFWAEPEEDGDIKIFSGSGGYAKANEDDGAAEFVRERDNGNLDKAKQLGRLLAQKVRRLWRIGDTPLLHKQKKVLYVYAAAKVIEMHCPSSVLSHAALSEFHRAVQQRSQKDYDSIQDSVAFTKYLLSERSGKEALGSVFAELCGEKGSAALQSRGMSLYYRYTGDCLAAFQQVEFQ